MVFLNFIFWTVSWKMKRLRASVCLLDSPAAKYLKNRGFVEAESNQINKILFQSVSLNLLNDWRFAILPTGAPDMKHCIISNDLCIQNSCRLVLILRKFNKHIVILPGYGYGHVSKWIGRSTKIL